MSNELVDLLQDTSAEVEQVLQEIYILLTPIVRVLEHRNRDVGVERLILARIQQERAERNDKAFIAGLECALRFVTPGGERFVAQAYLNDMENR